MSWIQNLFQKLRKDGEEEFDASFFHNDKTGDLPPPDKYESIKDVDVKVSYQYPKGTPSAPKRNKTSREGRSKNQKNKVVESSSSETTKVRTEKIELPKGKTEPLPNMRGPFHPTEIPSPVFGFNRPRKSTAIVEHELSHFSQTEAAPKESIAETAEEIIQLGTEDSESVPIVQNDQAVPAMLTKVIEKAERDHEEEITYKEPVSPPELSKGNIEVLEKEKTAEPFLNEENLEQRRSARSGRTHLPFNVMMLKQDKEKWELKQEIIRTQTDQSKPVQLKEPLEEKMLQDQTAVHKTRKMPISVPDTAGQRDEIGHYIFPEFSLLNPPISKGKDTEWLAEQEELLNQTLQNFNVSAGVVHVTQGPSVTRFEVQPEPGVKVNKITNLSDDIKLSLAARDIRIEAPIPGKHTIGIEVPNQTSRPVQISEIIQSTPFGESSSPLTAVLGLDIAGKPIVTDLKKMPHGLIAGATGSGKSVCVNSILISLLYKATPEDVRLLLIDPKMVELAPYNRIPHLVSPVITDVKAATAALKWAVEEMERRYELFAHTGVRDINRFNELAMEHKQYSDKLPFIVIIIDELADLMMMSPADVEEAICRIAQKARACGIHLIIATQRPSVDVITGLIKANIPTRIAFSVSSQIDSRTIIDISGAEKLLGRGDMLFLENGSSKPVRLQGTFVSDEEIDFVVGHVREQREPEYLFEQEELLKKAQVSEGEDELFFEVCEFIIDQGAASTSSLQRRFKIGYNRAARLMDMLEQNGYITSANGSKPREVLISEADFAAIQEDSYNV
ncbi:DNA translocase FtsK [Neobacillus kokaensis]|uniref:DNA translocase FtsK n=1 Tax=Neobacillus kokaensis TaxID=2759023 RepID=A0ABQ3MXB8_9BACI|nr:DNA translocase FtsK [Neobacillus kokaensis]